MLFLIIKLPNANKEIKATFMKVFLEKFLNKRIIGSIKMGAMVTFIKIINRERIHINNILFLLNQLYHTLWSIECSLHLNFIYSPTSLDDI